MKLWKAAAIILGCMVLAAALAAYPAKAADAVTITYALIRTPTELPNGKVLPAGDYAFKLVDGTASTKVVQILLALQDGTVGTPSAYNANKEMEVVATLLTIPDYVHRPARGVLTYWQGRGDGPAALRTLFFPTEPTALVFVYPQAQAAQIAKAYNQTVPSVASDLVADVNALKNMPVKATTAEGQNVDVSGIFGKFGDHLPPAAEKGGGCWYEAGEVDCEFGAGDAL
jgi:hypothetical protein